MFNITKKYFSRLKPLAKYLHFILIFLFLFEILISNFIKVHNNIISTNTIIYYSTWTHIIIGIITSFFLIWFIFIEFHQHGIKCFYPYLYGDFTQTKKDIEILKNFKLPRISKKGIIRIIEGIGLLSGFLTILFGIIWFYLFSNNYEYADLFKELHKIFVGIIEGYLIIHSGFAFLHIYEKYKKQLN